LTLAPKYLSFDELLQKRLFEIPSYQRAYSWDTKQRKDLFNDIEKLHGTNDSSNRKSHFMATVVCHNENRNEAYDTELYNVLNIVDGQQRITTLIILLKAIEKKLYTINLDNRFNRSINYINDLLVKDDNKRLILIQTNHSSSTILREYLIHGIYPKEIKTHAAKALNNGFKDCETFVEDWCAKYEITDLLILLRNDLYFILHILEDEAAVYTVFEVLNSRGLAVDWLDKCKSMLMGIAFEQSNNDKFMLEDKLHWLRVYWSKIYEEIGVLNIDGKDIVTFTATIYNSHQYSKIMEIDSAMDYFKTICLKDTENVLEVSKWLYDVTHQLKLIEQNVKKKAVNKVKHARFLQVAIKLSGHINSKEEKELLELWETTTFKVFGLFRKDSRHLVGEFVRLGHYIMGFDIISNQYSNVRFVKTKEKLVEIAYEHSWKDIGRILREEKSYGIWNQELRYFLYHYEKELSKINNNYFSEKNWDVIWSKNIENTIEHVYPQQDSDVWKGKVSKNKDHYRHLLGNLILLPIKLNSKASNSDFKSKLSIYNTSDINAAKEIGQKYSDWNYNSINARTEHLIGFAQSFWSIEGK